MKNWVKGMLIAAGVCVTAGLVVCGAAWAMGGRFSHYRYKRFGITLQDDQIETDRQKDEAVWEEAIESGGGTAHHEDDHAAYFESESLNQTEMIFDGRLFMDGRQITELEIKVTGGYVEVVPDETIDEINIVINNDDYRCDQVTDEDTLKVTVRQWTGNKILPDFDDFDEVGVEIRIPAGCEFQDVELEVKGGMLVACGIAAGNLDLELEAGILEVADGSVRELNSDCKAGELSYAGNVGWKMEADCSAGTIGYELTGREEDFSYELEKQMGSILINGTERGQFNKKTAVNNPEASKKAELECKAGEISVNFTD